MTRTREHTGVQLNIGILYCVCIRLARSRVGNFSAARIFLPSFWDGTPARVCVCVCVRCLFFRFSFVLPRISAREAYRPALYAWEQYSRGQEIILWIWEASPRSLSFRSNASVCYFFERFFDIYIFFSMNFSSLKLYSKVYLYDLLF